MSNTGWADSFNDIQSMKNNKRLLFTTCGFGGGMLGALLAELIPNFGHGLVSHVGYTSLWSAISAALITVALFAAGEIYNRKPFSLSIYRKGIFSGTIAGAIAGFVAQAVYSFQGEPNFFNQVIFRAFCWAIMGALLGWKLSTVVPNLGSTRGIIAGAIGGFVGGIGFLIASSIFVEILGRMCGLGVLGAALGLAVVAIEEMLRAARLDVIWAPNEVTSITLGSRPVYIGGGDDHVFIYGLPQHALGVVLENGKIQCIDSSSGKRSDLKEGSRIKIGKIEVIVRTKGQET
jgi:Ca-activated chloride channel family protein